VDCKKLLYSTYKNHATFAKPVGKDGGCSESQCTNYRTRAIGNDYNMYPQDHSLYYLQNNCVYRCKTNQWL